MGLKCERCKRVVVKCVSCNICFKKFHPACADIYVKTKRAEQCCIKCLSKSGKMYDSSGTSASGGGVSQTFDCTMTQNDAHNMGNPPCPQFEPQLPKDWNKMNESDRLTALMSELSVSRQENSFYRQEINKLHAVLLNHNTRINTNAANFNTFKTDVQNEIIDIKKAQVNPYPTCELVVDGIPTEMPFETCHIVSPILKSLGLTNFNPFVLGSRVIKKKNAQPNDPTYSIIIEMCSDPVCNKVIEARRLCKDGFTADNVFKSSTQNIIYINKLKPSNLYRMYRETMKRKHDANWYAVYENNGSIIAKKEKSSIPLNIITKSDLNMIK